MIAAKNILKAASLVAAALLLTACGGYRTVPISVQSDPLGAYVTYQLRSTHEDANDDWIFLGKTPIEIQRGIRKKDLKRANALRVRVMREGYVDQIKDFAKQDMEGEIEEKGRLFWNPRLVPNK